MKTASLSGSPRENVGKKDATALRAAGNIPGVLYGGSKEQHFFVSEIELNKLVYSPDVYKIEFDLGGNNVSAIIKDMQFHPVTDKILHMDLLELVDGKPVEVALPVRTQGNSIGVRNGGRLSINYRRLPLRAMPADLPDEVQIDVTEIKIGDSVRVRDVEIPGCTILAADSAVIIDVKRTRAAMAAEAAAESDGEGEAPAAEEAAE
ncbi:MAG: 50S ribosomal protein L25 [Bacteroidota bacterium]